MCGSDFRRLQEGDDLLLQYLADRPTVSRVNLEDVRSRGERLVSESPPIEALRKVRRADDRTEGEAGVEHTRLPKD